MNEREARKWVRGWWAAKMRAQDVPDLPTEHDIALAPVFEDESRKLAARIEPEN